MNSKSFIFKYLPICLLLITVNSHGESLKLGSYLFWSIIEFFMLVLFWLVKTNYTSLAHKNSLKYLDWYIYYVFLQITLGALISDGYWEFKNLLTNSLSLLIPMVAFASNSKSFLKHLFTHYIFYTAPLFLVIQFFINKDEYGFFLAPFSLFTLFFPILTFRWKILTVVIATYVIFADFGARSNVIKFMLPFLFTFIYYFNRIFSAKILEFIRLMFFLAPFIFFVLATSGYFNIFNPQGDNKKEIIDIKRDSKGQIIEEDLTGDTRTFLYIEVIETAKKYNSWIFGRTPARGNISEVFGEADLTNRKERNGNEVGILNYFVWLGVVGVIFMFLLFYQATNLAVNYSNNIFSKIIGMFIAFRWAFSWVEDINNFTIQFVFLWIFIGICFSENFRKMNNEQIKNWVQSIFILPRFRRF